MPNDDKLRPMTLADYVTYFEMAPERMAAMPNWKWEMLTRGQDPHWPAPIGHPNSQSALDYGLSQGKAKATYDWARKFGSPNLASYPIEINPLKAEDVGNYGGLYEVKSDQNYTGRYPTIHLDPGIVGEYQDDSTYGFNNMPSNALSHEYGHFLWGTSMPGDDMAFRDFQNYNAEDTDTWADTKGDPRFGRAAEKFTSLEPEYTDGNPGGSLYGYGVEQLYKNREKMMDYLNQVGADEKLTQSVDEIVGQKVPSIVQYPDQSDRYSKDQWSEIVNTMEKDAEFAQGPYRYPSIKDGNVGKYKIANPDAKMPTTKRRGLGAITIDSDTSKQELYDYLKAAPYWKEELLKYLQAEAPKQTLRAMSNHAVLPYDELPERYMGE